MSIYYGLNILLLGIYTKEVIKQGCKFVCPRIAIKPVFKSMDPGLPWWCSG